MGSCSFNSLRRSVRVFRLSSFALSTFSLAQGRTGAPRRVRSSGLITLIPGNSSAESMTDWESINMSSHFDSFTVRPKDALESTEASQCGYVVSASASRQGDPGSNPIAARKSCEVYPGLGILQPQWNPYPTLTPPSC